MNDPDLIRCKCEIVVTIEDGAVMLSIGSRFSEAHFSSSRHTPKDTSGSLSNDVIPPGVQLTDAELAENHRVLAHTHMKILKAIQTLERGQRIINQIESGELE